MNARSRSLLLAATCVCTMLALPVLAHAASTTTSDEFVPRTVTPAQVAAATPAQPYLVGLSKEYPPICADLTSTKLEDTNATTNTDRVDVGTPFIELEGLTPGTTYSYCFFVQNVGKDPIKFRISATELVGVNDPDIKQQLIRPPKSVGAWLHPVATSFSLKPGERQYIPYTIDIPTNPPAGTSAGALEVVRLQDESQASGAGFFISMLHKVLVTFPGGTPRKLEVTQVQAPRVLTHENGKKHYRLRFNVHNVSNMVDVHHTKLTITGLGRTIKATRSSDSVLLPNGAERVELRADDLPWIGIYHPQAQLTSNTGTTHIPLPWLFILPPWPYTVALVLAILFPIVVLLRRWRRRQAAWDESSED